MHNRNGTDQLGERFSIAVLIACALLFGYLTYQIFRPFLISISWAVVFSILMYPLYLLLLARVRQRSAAALLTLLVIILLIIGPISYLSFLLVKELGTLIQSAESGRIEAVRDIFNNPSVTSAIDWLARISGSGPEDWGSMVTAHISQLGKEFAGKVTRGVGSIIMIAVNFIFMCLTTFFLLRDGSSMLEKVRDYLPFSEKRREQLVKQVRDIVISTMYGGVVVALVQGTAGGATFFFLGISSPVLWGFTMAVASFLPLIGPFLIWGPAAAYLVFQGELWRGIALAVIGFFGISLIDNVLRPILVGQRTKIHFLLLFFSVLGGIKLFGLIGFILGPLVLAVFVSVLDACRNTHEIDRDIPEKVTTPEI
jgi:predicted PurR-regulated permease PerM